MARPADPAAVDDAAWADFLYMRSNPKGRHAERWRHIHGCGQFFNCLRDTVSDRVETTYKPGEKNIEIMEYAGVEGDKSAGIATEEAAKRGTGGQ